MLLVGNGAGVVRVRPIVAPYDPVAELGDQRSGKGLGVGVGWAQPRDAVHAAHLDPEALVRHQPQQRLEVRLVKTQRRIDAPDVVDHHRRGRATQCGRQVREQRGIAVNLQMPAKRREAARQRQDPLHVRVPAEVAHEVEADATKACGVEPLEFCVVDVGRQQGDRAVARGPRRNGVLGGAVVEAVAGRLHDHAALQAEAVVQRIQGFLGRICFGNEGGVRGVRKARAGPRTHDSGRCRRPGEGGRSCRQFPHR